eukprot:366178-Chlamydomonas_euryale.AAC.4
MCSRGLGTDAPSRQGRVKERSRYQVAALQRGGITEWQSGREPDGRSDSFTESAGVTVLPRAPEGRSDSFTEQQRYRVAE